MKEIKAIIQPFMLGRVCDALEQIEGLPGLTVSQVLGWGKARAADAEHTVQEAGCTFVKKTKIEIVVPDALTARVVDAIANAARTGNLGDGKVFVYDVGEVMRIRTGEYGESAI